MQVFTVVLIIPHVVVEDPTNISRIYAKDRRLSFLFKGGEEETSPRRRLCKTRIKIRLRRTHRLQQDLLHLVSVILRRRFQQDLLTISSRPILIYSSNNRL